MVEDLTGKKGKEIDAIVQLQESRVSKLKAAACVLSDIRMEPNGIPAGRSALLAGLTEVVAEQEAKLRELHDAVRSIRMSCMHMNEEKTGYHGMVVCHDCGLVW